MHNERLLRRHLGRTPIETLQRFRTITASTVAPSGHTPAWLGEVIVHGHDIRQPLGLVQTSNIDALTPVAEFFAQRNFTVRSRSRIAGVQLRAVDGPFAVTGNGPLVSGPTLALVMTMAGRAAYLDELAGPGLPTLRARLLEITG